MSLLIELLRVALNRQKRLSTIPSTSDWQFLYDTAVLQSVVGVCFSGIKKLPKEQWPPQNVLYQWMGMSLNIQHRNELMNKRTAEVWEKLEEEDLHAAVLKGQGVANEYVIDDMASLRQSGDIDVWVLGGYRTVCDYVQSVAPTTDVAYHRFHFDVFNDVEVELHHRPTLMRNLIDDRKLAKWYNSFGADCFVYLDKKGFAVPPACFNRIFILTHIYRHFLFEGIGLRQLIDLYFVLHNSKGEHNELHLLKKFRLLRFARAVMWIMKAQFGLEDEKLMACGVNEAEGKFVFEEIKITGNFGRADHRYDYRYLYKVRKKFARGAHLILHYPSEVFWTPIWLIYHHYWKKARINEILKSNR